MGGYRIPIEGFNLKDPITRDVFAFLVDIIVSERDEHAWGEVRREAFHTLFDDGELPGISFEKGYELWHDVEERMIEELKRLVGPR